jgi:energy-coupling factor transporter ATP-binding protein EcfA2
MELRHIAMVNWHLFDVEDIAIAGNAGILGENASGKSTVLDMIQVVLTGASRSYLRLNAIAGEGARTRSGSRRSVHGYCLGTVREGELRRTDAFTYLSLGFVDREGKQPPISIGLALHANSANSSETVYGRFVAIGRMLTTSDFLEERPDGWFPAPWDEVKARISAAVGAGRFINHRDRALDYVREYMRHLVPTLPASEPSASAMLKATVNAMSLNHGLSATEFVRNFILEDNPIRIGELRASIETYKGVSATIATMRRKLEALKAIGAALDLYQESCL